MFENSYIHKFSATLAEYRLLGWNLGIRMARILVTSRALLYEDIGVQVNTNKGEEPPE